MCLLETRKLFSTVAFSLQFWRLAQEPLDLPATIVVDSFLYPTFCKLAPVPIPLCYHFERAPNICLSVHHMLEWCQRGGLLI